MFTRVEQYITQTKLRELRKQRDRLLAGYRALRQRVDETPDEAGQLRLLYDGLRAISFADKPLHPEVANLEPVLYELETAGQAMPDTLAFWRTRLAQELTSGHVRSEIVYVFGALLEEWATQEATDGAADDHDTIRDELREALGAAVTPDDAAFSSLLERLFDGWPARDASAVQRAVDGLTTRVELHELDMVLARIGRDRYRRPAVRSEALHVLSTPLLRKELGDALTIALDTLETWTWPEAGLPTHAAWTANKWRLFIDDELPDACLLEIMGRRWQAVFNVFQAQLVSAQLQLLRQFAYEAVSPATLAQEVHRYGAVLRLDSADAAELWASGSGPDGSVRRTISIQRLEELRQGGRFGSILRQRGEIKSKLGDADDRDSYGDQSGRFTSDL